MVADDGASFVMIRLKARVEIQRGSNNDNNLGGIQGSFWCQKFPYELEAGKELGIYEPQTD